MPFLFVTPFDAAPHAYTAFIRAAALRHVDHRSRYPPAAARLLQERAMTRAAAAKQPPRPPPRRARAAIKEVEVKVQPRYDAHEAMRE